MMSFCKGGGGRQGPQARKDKRGKEPGVEEGGGGGVRWKTRQGAGSLAGWAGKKGKKSHRWIYSHPLIIDLFLLSLLPTTGSHLPSYMFRCMFGMSRMFGMWYVGSASLDERLSKFGITYLRTPY